MATSGFFHCGPDSCTIPRMKRCGKTRQTLLARGVTTVVVVLLLAAAQFHACRTLPAQGETPPASLSAGMPAPVDLFVQTSRQSAPNDPSFRPDGFGAPPCAAADGAASPPNTGTVRASRTGASPSPRTVLLLKSSLII